MPLLLYLRLMVVFSTMGGTLRKKAIMSKKSRKKSAVKLNPAVLNQRPKVGGLGRGLDALLGSASANTALPKASVVEGERLREPIVDGKSILFVSVTAIVPSPYQPRQTFDPAALEELDASIKSQGVITPVVCRRSGTGRYELIAGERRLRAATEAGLAEVPVLVVSVDDSKAAEMALVENLQRADLNIIEEAEGYQSLARNFSLTQQEIAERVGKPRASVANAVRLLELSEEIRQMLVSGALSAGHAKVLLSVESPDSRHTLAQLSIRDGWTVRILEQKVKRVTQEPTPHRTVTPELPSDHHKLITDKLHERFMTSVRLSPSVRYANGKRGKGRIEIDYLDNADLDRLLHLLGIVLDDDL